MDSKRICKRCGETKEIAAFTSYLRASNQKRFRDWCDVCIEEVGNIKSSAYRKDVWAESEDTFLVDTILKYIHYGKTQLQAFHDIGEKLERSWTAVDHRWNHILRKHYKEQIAEAKLMKKFRK